MGRRVSLSLTIAQVQCVRALAAENEQSSTSPDLRERCAGVVREADRVLAFDERTTDANAKRRRAQTRSDP